MKKFIKFINESKGISEINKIYTDYFVEYYIQLGYGEFVIEDNVDQRLPLMNCLLNIKKGETHALFDPTESFLKKEDEDFYLYNIIFTININNKDDIWLLKELMSHELNHCIEYYNISKWNERNKINDEVYEIRPKHLSIKKSFTKINVEPNNPFSFFKHLVYLSLDSEYNSRVSQIFQYLKSFNSKDKEFLKDKIKDSKSYDAYLQIENFNTGDFIKNCVDKIGLIGIIKITKDLNDQLKNNNINKLVSYNFIKDDVIEYKDLINYYRKWEKLFKYKNKKYIENLYRMIDVVIDENGLREGYGSEYANDF
jgi:hypothetical protein